MSLKLIMVSIAAAFVLAGVACYYLYPPLVLQRHTQAALDDFGKTVASKDSAAIEAHLRTLLADNAHLRLEVTYANLFKQNNPAIVQEFEVDSFVTFISNIIYSLQDYNFAGEIRHFELSADKKTAALAFHVDAQADGNSAIEGTSIDLHYITETTCNGHVAFEGKTVRLTDAVCVLQLSSVPKSGEEKKLQNPAVLKEILR